MAAEQPKVSVVVPTRDRPELLRRAVTAILGQTYKGPVECLVVFDQSDPDLPWPDLPPGRTLVLCRNDRTPGLAGARNSGILAATGELVAFCDDDDEWLPEKLARQVARLLATPGAAVSTTGILVRYQDRTTTRLAPTILVSHRQLLRSRLTELHPSTVLARRDRLLSQIGLVDEEIPGSYAEDYEWLLRASRHGPVLAVPEPLAVIHWHQSSFFADRWRTIISALTYLVDKHRDLQQEPSGLARIYGQIAFAHAALGERKPARRWARRTLSLNRRERRAYLALAISLGLVSAKTVVRLAHVAGKGI
ncbi:MAG TPA: glycosyltransferase family 2 protein [Actinomycetes bacterium]|nr:glycosyltransferase family 2 protein [Actinomycetes bacterium]